jgi:hypothetical protein
MSKGKYKRAMMPRKIKPTPRKPQRKVGKSRKYTGKPKIGGY